MTDSKPLSEHARPTVSRYLAVDSRKTLWTQCNQFTHKVRCWRFCTNFSFLRPAASFCQWQSASKGLARPLSYFKTADSRKCWAQSSPENNGYTVTKLRHPSSGLWRGIFNESPNPQCWEALLGVSMTLVLAIATPKGVEFHKYCWLETCKLLKPALSVKGLSRSEAEALYPPDQPQAYESASLVGIGDGLFLVFEFWLLFFLQLWFAFFCMAGSFCILNLHIGRAPWKRRIHLYICLHFLHNFFANCSHCFCKFKAPPGKVSKT